MATIILTGGGTAGHCIPHLALIPYLKNNFDKIYYIGSENGIEKHLVKENVTEYFSVTTTKLKRCFSLDNFAIPFKLIKGIKQAKILLKKLNPDIIFSKGGYVSLPVVLAGKSLNIPIISHESDLSIGLANKLSSKYSKKVLTSFPETALSIKNGEYSGAPIRYEFFNVNRNYALSYFCFNGKKPILVITGGSQGAKSINDVVFKSLDKLLLKFDIIHAVGKNNLKKINPVNGYYQTEFIDKMYYALGIADVVVSRAGSNTVFEILSLAIPNVLIPLPKDASRGDQLLNAEYFRKKGLSIVLKQEQLSPSSLICAIEKAFNQKNIIVEKCKQYNIKDASMSISKTIFDSLI